MKAFLEKIHEYKSTCLHHHIINPSSMTNNFLQERNNHLLYCDILRGLQGLVIFLKIVFQPLAHTIRY